MPDEPELRFDSSVYRDSEGIWILHGVLTMGDRVHHHRSRLHGPIEGAPHEQMWKADASMRPNHTAWLQSFLKHRVGAM